MNNNLFGTWSVNVISPLGSDTYSLSISETMSAVIGEMRGSMKFDDVKFESNNFQMFGTTSTPTKSHIVIRGVIVDNQISGKIQINDYCTVDFKGTKNG